MDVQEAANSCSCGEHQQLMDAFDAIEGDCVVAAAAGIVAALLSCKCDRSRGLLLEALDVVAQRNHGVLHRPVAIHCGSQKNWE